MKASYLYILGALATIAGYYAFQKQQKKNRNKENKKDYSNIDFTKEYFFEPNWKRIKLELVVILILCISICNYYFQDPDFQNIEERIFFGSFIFSGFLFIWTFIFFMFNKRKVVISKNHLSIYSFFSTKQKKIDWDEIESAKYLTQNDKIRVEKKAPSKFDTNVGLMHFKSNDKKMIKDLIDANLEKRGKKIQVRYW